MKRINLYELSVEELTTRVSEGLKIHIDELFKQLSENEPKGKEFLSRKETADFFGVSLVTIHSWTNEGLITVYKLGNRSYYKRSQLVESLLNSKNLAS